ncbi:hypothetical protein FF38_10650 [Lucilia cuprina]|uniref:Uncharacterized protein n=1 Tax=Lucilia cuprina TaxID=7375 RepID=A0A0L0CQ01_LUCCU|nr:hypothetical protein FF38_10650 [Lucilia cuprina]
MVILRRLQNIFQHKNTGTLLSTFWAAVISRMSFYSNQECTGRSITNKSSTFYLMLEVFDIRKRLLQHIRLYSHEYLPKLAKFGCWSFLKGRCRKKELDISTVKPTANEMNWSFLKIVEIIQNDEYSQEIKKLQNSQVLFFSDFNNYSWLEDRVIRFRTLCCRTKARFTSPEFFNRVLKGTEVVPDWRSKTILFVVEEGPCCPF